MRKPLLALLLIIAAASAAWAWRTYGNKQVEAGWQGWVEGDYLFIGPDEAGRLTSLDVRQGQSVAKSAPLFAVQSDLQSAELQQAAAALKEAEARLARANEAQQRPEEIAVLEAQKTRAKAALEKSQPDYDRAKDLVAKGISPPSRLDDAAASLARDRAALVEAERQIDVARLKSRIEDIAAARAVVEQAKSRLSAAEVSLSRRTITAPAEGIVQEVFYRHGEVVPAGRPVLSLLPPGNVKLRFFVPEAKLASIEPGTQIEASCDGCAEPIKATVTFVSTEAEFTPPVIFSREERHKLVFRVEAKPVDPASLRVGLPITVEANIQGNEHGIAKR
ncbi:MAG: HlyD family efflux transporter periplasmic adaptor subunit [Hyphomicrobiaceae bacterium]|nr:HlyD family efflux transporter periplasmic adaptor subunit [Hyphomicrobiaceae bacterium]